MMENNIVNDIKIIINQARNRAYSAIRSEMVEAYWAVGKRIVEEEQSGKNRAEYGKEILKNLATELTKEFGKGYSERSLREFRQFYMLFSDVENWRTLFAKLSWSHFQRVLRVTNEKARAYYLNEAAANAWSIRNLDRNISTLYYERLLASQVKEPIINEMIENNKQSEENSLMFIKNPYVLDFLQIPIDTKLTETQLEQALLDNIRKFLLELGKGFAFVARQQLVRTDTADFYIDLVFYNYILKCFVLIELKNDKITHQDIGQLDMYVRMYDDLHRQESDNPTIGILLCTETDNTIAKYSVLNQNKQLFATKYMPFLPTEEELKEVIERQKLILESQLYHSQL